MTKVISFERVHVPHDGLAMNGGGDWTAPQEKYRQLAHDESDRGRVNTLTAGTKERMTIHHATITTIQYFAS